MLLLLNMWILHYIRLSQLGTLMLLQFWKKFSVQPINIMLNIDFSHLAFISFIHVSFIPNFFRDFNMKEMLYPLRNFFWFVKVTCDIALFMFHNMLIDLHILNNKRLLLCDYWESFHFLLCLHLVSESWWLWLHRMCLLSSLLVIRNTLRINSILFVWIFINILITLWDTEVRKQR